MLNHQRKGGGGVGGTTQEEQQARPAATVVFNFNLDNSKVLGASGASKLKYGNCSCGRAKFVMVVVSLSSVLNVLHLRIRHMKTHKHEERLTVCQKIQELL